MTDNWNGRPEESPHAKAESYKSRMKQQGKKIKGIDPDDDDEILSVAQLYQRGKKVLEDAGYKLERSPLGVNHAGHIIYEPIAPRRVRGISYPSDFKHYIQVDTESSEKLLIDIFVNSDLDTATRKFWMPLTHPMEDNKKSGLIGYVNRLTQTDSIRDKQNEGKPYESRIQLANFGREHRPHSFIPAREWFDPEIQKLKFTDIFTIFPTAEAELLQLMIGRACFGGSGNILTGEDGVFDHTHRTVSLIVGEDAGLGKSTLFNKLFAAMNRVGYRRANFRSLNEKFGLGEVVTAHAAYKDDMTAATLKDLVAAENTKTVASGGWLYVEDKYMKGANVKCTAAIFANTNSFNPRDSYSMDSGIVSRVALIGTYRMSELDELARPRLSPQIADSGNVAPFSHISFVAQKLGVDEEALMLWCCRLGVDEFRKHVTKRDVEVPTESLKQAIHNLSTYLRYSYNKDITRSIAQAMAFSHILLRHLPSEYTRDEKYVLKELNPDPLKYSFLSFRKLAGDRRLYRLRALIKSHWEMMGRPDLHPWSAFRKLNLATLDAAREKLDLAMGNKLGVAKLVEMVWGELYLRDGFQGSKDLVHVTRAWESTRSDIKMIEALARVVYDIIREGYKNPQSEAGVFADCFRALGQQSDNLQVDTSWINSEEYSPGEVDKLLYEQSEGFTTEPWAEKLKTCKWVV